MGKEHRPVVMEEEEWRNFGIAIYAAKESGVALGELLMIVMDDMSSYANRGILNKKLRKETAEYLSPYILKKIIHIYERK
jgi:hexokinase